MPPEIRTALLDPSLQVQAGFARLSHGRGDDNVDGLMPDVRGLWVRLQAAVGVQDLTATNGEVPFAHVPEELIAFGSATAELLKASRAHRPTPAAAAAIPSPRAACSAPGGEPPHTVRSKRNSRVWLMSSASSRSPARRNP